MRATAAHAGAEAVASNTMTLSCSQRRAVIRFGWVFFLISLGGQAPHVLRAQMGVHRTCGEPNEIELTPMGVKLNGSRRVRVHTGGPWAQAWFAGVGPVCVRHRSLMTSAGGARLSFDLSTSPRPIGSGARDVREGAKAWLRHARRWWFVVFVVFVVFGRLRVVVQRMRTTGRAIADSKWRVQCTVLVACRLFDARACCDLGRRCSRARQC